MTRNSVHPMMVLVVDDDPDTREMYQIFLDHSGIAVRTASNADEAFTLAVECQPTVVITDFLLAGSMTGVDLCRRLREDARTAHIPAVLMTGWTRKAEAEAAHGCAEVRIKPYLPDAMLDDVRALTAR